MIRKSISAIRLALQFLTRLPVKSSPTVPTDHELASSVKAFPIAGAVIGFVLACFIVLTQALPDYLQAALVLIVWVALTGNLHMDGLADTADAWAGGRGQKDRILAIMKDPHTGAAAVSVVVLTLLVKWSAVSALLPGDNLLVFFLVPIVPRATMLLFFTSMQYLRSEGGLASGYSDAISHTTLAAILLLTFLVVIALAAWLGILMFAAAVASFVIFYFYWRLLLGGYTGDIIGAYVEITECLMLVVAVAWLV
ncbi:MAG: adenosylcobinamide-GDP ribazoletransferase [Gammaproteobacteria bacterium]|nr:adenosylcobinamide-GDP ribazoletransferase [Gammaproteobacteria bacterium]